MSDRAPTAPTKAPIPIAALRYPTPAVAEVEQLERSHDDEHLDARRTSPSVRSRRHHHHSRERSRASVVKPASRSAAIVDASSSRRGRSTCSTWMRTRKSADDDDEQRRRCVKTRPVLATASRMPASAGPAKTAMLSTAARDRVRCRQLLGGSRERRRQRCLGRTERRRGDGRCDREPVDDPRTGIRRARLRPRRRRARSG